MSEGVEVRIPDIFRLNDWEIRKFIVIVLSTLIAYDATFLADKFLFKIPILPQLLGFVILTFIPGFIILRILKVHNIDRTQNFLLAVGLSLSFIMIYGLFLNTLLPHLGILKPMSPQPLFYAFNIGILGLLLVAYLRDKKFIRSQEFLSVNISLLTLSLFLLPSISILGAYIMNNNQNNTILLLLLLLLSLLPLIIFTKLPKDIYAVIVYVSSVSLLFHKSLIKPYIWGWDIQIEYFFANLVYSNSIWDSSYPQNINAMLSITMLAPIYSMLCDIPLDYTFKVVYPLLFSFVPVALYYIFKHQTGEKIGYLASFYFMSGAGFYEELIHLGRQQIAEIFLALLILLLISNGKEGKTNTIAFAILFGASLVVSHYGTSYLFILLLIIFLISRLVFRSMQKETIAHNFVTLYIVMALTWYLYISSGSPFITIVNLGNHVISNLQELFNPATSGMIDPVITPTTPARTVTKILGLISIFFIIVGVLRTIFNAKLKETRSTFFHFIVAAFTVNIIATVVPYFTAMHASRLFHLTLFFLSPFCILGGLRVVKVAFNDKKRAEILIALFLTILFLFNSGFVYTICNEHSSIALDKSYDAITADYEETQCMLWLLAERDKEKPIYADFFGRASLNKFFYGDEPRVFLSQTNDLSNGYIYLRGKNVEDGIIKEDRWIRMHHEFVEIPLKHTTFYKKVITTSNKVYSNGGSEIFIPEQN